MPEVSADTAFSRLEGWEQEDHLAALAAFASTCRVSRDPGEARICAAARDLAAASGALTDADAKAFFEAHFQPRPYAIEGLLTAYYTPVYDARRVADEAFTAPVRPRPADLPRNGGAYAARAAIDERPAPDALAWMRPEDLFFLQIQGSGVLIFPDGDRRRAVFDGSNGAAFLGIARPMRLRGLLANDETSADRIHAWLAEHRGPEAEMIMALDPRYVFLRLEADDGVEPSGAAGVRLVPGRSLAVDPSAHAMGDLFWIDAAAPALSGAFPTYRRLAIALDTGSAIRGQVRADLYTGRGPEAGTEAGRVRHTLRLYRFIPRPGEGS